MGYLIMEAINFYEQWLEREQEISSHDTYLKGKSCYAGVVRDYKDGQSKIVLVFKLSGHYHVRAKTCGYDLDDINECLLKLDELYNIKEVLVDNWEFPNFMIEELQKSFTVTKTLTGKRNVTPVIRELQTLLNNKLICHNGRTGLGSHLRNATFTLDANYNFSLVKVNSEEPAYGVKALIMALSKAMQQEESSMKIDEQGNVTIKGGTLKARKVKENVLSYDELKECLSEVKRYAFKLEQEKEALVVALAKYIVEDGIRLKEFN